MKVFPMKIKTKRRYKLCDYLTNNKEYTLISMFPNPHAISGVSFVIIADDDVSRSLDSEFFRLNSLKLNN